MTYFCPICGADTQGQSACPNWVNHPGVNTGARTMTTMTLSEASKELRDAAAQALGLPNRRWYASLADAIDAHLANGAQWQPIETAPRDGTEIFLWQSDHTVPVVAHWYWFGDRELMQGCWVANKSFYSAEHSVVEDDTDTKYVTHWMPLPDAPMLSQRGEVES